MKENYFRPFLETHGRDRLGYPDEGRKQLMLDALANYDGMKSRCPELAELERRIREHLETRN